MSYKTNVWDVSATGLNMMSHVWDQQTRTYVFYWAVLRCLSTTPIRYLGLCNLHLLYRTKLPVLESKLVKAELHFHSKTPFLILSFNFIYITFDSNTGYHTIQNRTIVSYSTFTFHHPSAAGSWNVRARSLDSICNILDFSEVTLKMPSSGMWRRMALVTIEASEERIASIIMELRISLESP
jgi:hypothetical protein